MEALSLVVNSKIIADDVRCSTSGYDEVRRTAEEALRVRPVRRRLWSAVWRNVSTRGPRLVAQSSGD
ncbi:hypothetical protein [Kribbella ginsengisoli]|uniref:hypothetical protein n=1 Tax=Kribbella ginsengisoli TaxID=363865 RepID=UPI0031E307A3